MSNDSVLRDPRILDSLAKLQACSRAGSKDDFDFHAWNMANLHIGIFEGFKVSYQRAETVSKADYKNWIFYCWANVHNLHEHHEIEEQTYFPFFEAKQDKSMQGNVDEHAVFTGKLDILESWLGKCLADVSLYDPAEHRRQIAEVLPLIMPHLAHELDTLNADWIRNNFTKAELDTVEKKVQKHVQSKDPFVGVPIVILHTPPKSEIGGQSWPHMPWFVRHILGPWVFSWKHRGAWKYAPYTYSEN